MFERLPTPWGLVRLGVAPDHPEDQVRLACLREDRAAAGLPLLRQRRGRAATSRTSELAGLYDAVVYAFGAQADRRMGIPGEDLPGSWPATAFVAWYNGHPDFQGIPFDLSGRSGRSSSATGTSRSTWRGCSRSPTTSSRATDTTDEAIDAIVGSGIAEILVLGRRGPAQAAFTTPELQRAHRARRCRPRRRRRRPRARSGERRSARGRHRACAPQRRGAARGGRPTPATGKSKTPAPALLRLTGRDPRRRPRRGRRDRPERARRRLPAAGSARCRPTSGR